MARSAKGNKFWIWIPRIIINMGYLDNYFPGLALFCEAFIATFSLAVLTGIVSLLQTKFLLPLEKIGMIEALIVRHGFILQCKLWGHRSSALHQRIGRLTALSPL